MPVKTKEKPGKDDVWEILERIAQEQEKLTKQQRKLDAQLKNELSEQQKQLSEQQKQFSEQQSQLKAEQKKLAVLQQKTERSIGRLSNRFGEVVEQELVLDLTAKFKKFGYSFKRLSQNITIDDKENDICTEIDAFLENGEYAMVVEVKVNLKTDDVNEHLARMEKVRRNADLHNDKRKFLGAIAATVIAPNVKEYALKEGFYVVEPSGESVKIVKPPTPPREW